MSKVFAVTSQDFEKEVLQSETPVLLDFWAEWCGPCKMVSPILDQLSDEYDGKLKIAKVNVDENPEVAAQYRVRGIPTILILKNGQVEETFVGAKPKSELQSLIEKHI